MLNILRGIGLKLGLLKPTVEEVKTQGTPRSPHWPVVRGTWLRKHPTCAACGRTDFLEVHHKQPFHLHPELELDESNFITLCEGGGSEDHLHVGHKDPSTGKYDWKCFNPNVERDAAERLKERQRV